MRRGSLIGPTIVAIGLVAAAIAFAVISTLLSGADVAQERRMEKLEQAAATASSKIQQLSSQVTAMRSDIERLEADIARRATATPAPGSSGFELLHEEAVGDAAETEAPTEIMTIRESSFNNGVTQANNRIMLELLGHPRESYSQTCQSMTNERLASALETRQIGPIRVTMLRPALDSIARIFAELERTDPDIVAKIGTAGALCVRNIRGSSTGVSNHSWGTAIDITVAGQLDGFGDGGTQFALLIIAEKFNQEGWYWGATYGREDSMHFEVGAETIRSWVEQGLI